MSNSCPSLCPSCICPSFLVGRCGHGVFGRRLVGEDGVLLRGGIFFCMLWLVDHLRIHHGGCQKGLTLAAFNAQRNEPRVRALLGNSTVRERTDIGPTTGDATPKAGNAAGASLHEGSTCVVFWRSRRSVNT
jgi:hypothetical protein